MIGLKITDADGKVLDQFQNLAESTYQPSSDVMKFMERVQTDYQVAYSLQNRTFEEFDGYSLLQRTRLDQQTFAAYVGCEWVPKQNRWRWKGRKNTARNKLIGILAHVIAGMLFPFVHAQNDKDEPDKMTARVMRILVEEHLRAAKYEIKFLYIALSALVNPATIVQVEYVVAYQRVKQRLKDGKIKVIEAIDELLTGLNINTLQVDELLLPDFYSGTGNLQILPNLIRVRRISWDTARAIYAGKHFNKDGKDLFDFVMPGKTRVVISGADNQTLFSIDWTEADQSYVQVITAYYRSEDIEVDIVGGVFMGDETDVYNGNPFKHRRMSLVGDEWITIPVYPFVMSGFEPIDPAGRFAYFKSGAFKEYWDDLGSNTMDRLMMDGTYLDVFKPQFLSGVAKSDSTVMAPGATVYMPANASATMYSLGPNLVAAITALKERERNMSESTQDPIMNGQQTPNVTATATLRAEQNARIFLGVFGLMIAEMVKQIGELTMDCVIQHTTIGELDATLPEALRMKYKTILAKGKEQGRDVTNRIMMTDTLLGYEMTKKDIENMQWDLFEKSGGEDSDQRIYMVNPYKFARTKYSMWVDADKIIMRSTGTDQQRQLLAFQMMSDPRVQPFVDMKNVVHDFVIEPFSDGDPTRYEKKEDDIMNQMMMPPQGQGAPSDMVVPPVPSAFG